jgi:hypothetical protein
MSANPRRLSKTLSLLALEMAHHRFTNSGMVAVAVWKRTNNVFWDKSGANLYIAFASMARHFNMALGWNNL